MSKNKRGDVENMRNRDGTLLARYSVEQGQAFVPEPLFYKPTKKELERVQLMRATASAMRSSSDAIRGLDVRRADLLLNRARQYEMAAALVLLGESGDADD